MENNIEVKVIYKNAKLEPVRTEHYSLNDYTAMIRHDLLRLITDIEDSFYYATGNKTQDEWPDEIWASFLHIKHKILDKAGSIGRLPENICIGEKTCQP